MTTDEEPQGRPTPPSPGKLAQRATQTLQALNETTARNGGYANPPAMAATLARLTHVMRGLTQAIDDAGRWLQAEDAAGRVGTDDPQGPNSVEAAIEALTIAKAQAEALAPHLDLASARAYHLALATAERTG